MPAEIRTGTSILTLVNVFQTTPEQQQQLIDVLMTATARAMQSDPACQAEMKKVLELARPDVHLYDVISTTHPPC